MKVTHIYFELPVSRTTATQAKVLSSLQKRVVVELCQEETKFVDGLL